MEGSSRRMNTKTTIKTLFIVAALYDGLLGLLVLLQPYFLFNLFTVTPPNHPGYVQFPAALLIVFGLMFAAIAIEPVRNRNLIPYGILLKICYSGTVFSYWASSGIPNMWKPFAIADLVFIFLFLWAFKNIPIPGNSSDSLVEH